MGEHKDQISLCIQELIGCIKEELHKFIGLPYETFPKSSQERIAKQTVKNSYTHQSVCGNSNKEWEAKLKLSPDFPPTLELIDRSSGVRCDATTDDLQDFFDGEEVHLHWNGFVSWIHSNVLPHVLRDFDKVCQAETQEMDSNTIELSRKLRLSQVFLEQLKQEKGCLEEENKELLLAKGYLCQSKDNLERVVVTSVIQLQKAAQDLRATRTFLGQSKTIKKIREDVERVTTDLWHLVYAGDPPSNDPWDGRGDPPWPRPPQRKVPPRTLDPLL